MNGLFLRALLAFLALPGMVAFVVPLLLLTPRARRAWVDPWGAAPLALGLVVLASTVREFYVAGRGTLAPWSPPKTLVVSGLYRYSRNPMYVGVLLILCGWAIGLRSPVLAIYAACVAIAVHVRVLLHEEPFLARTQPEAWAAPTGRACRAGSAGEAAGQYHRRASSAPTRCGSRLPSCRPGPPVIRGPGISSPGWRSRSPPALR
jgi:protein-S-isoprenylcysteine O-methyltransferase Ste14